MKVIYTAGLLGTLLVSGIAAAQKNPPAKHSAGDYKEAVAILSAGLASPPSFDETKMLAEIKTEGNLRRPSAFGFGGGADADIEKLKTNLWACNDGTCLGALLDQLNTDYDTLSPPAKLFAIHILPIRAFRGILYKTRPLFERKSAFIQSEAVTRVRRLAASLSLHIPADHVQAFVDYLAAPYSSSDKSGVTAFPSESYMQMYLARTLGTELFKSIERLSALKINDPIMWDNQLLHGRDTFKDGTRRYSYYGKLERMASFVAFYVAAHDLNVFVSYNVDDALKAVKDVGHLYGLDGFKNLVSGFSQVDGVSKIDVATTLRRSTPRLGTLIESQDPLNNGHVTMANALRAASLANKAFQILWKASKGATSDDDSMLQLGMFNIRRKYKDQTAQLINDMYNVDVSDPKKITPRNHPIAIRSLVTGEVVQVDVDKFYLDPPSDLKDFLPVGGEKAVRRVATVDGKAIPYRDYFAETPATWNIKPYQKYFPGTANNGTDVKKIRRVMASARRSFAVEN